MRLRLLTITILAITAMLLGCGGASSAPPPPSKSYLSITSTPPTAAQEGQPYTYVVSASGAGESAVTYQLVAAPAGATLAANTLTWVPSSDQSRTSSSFTLSAASGGSSALQNWSVTPAGHIQGTRIITFVTDSGDIAKADDASNLQIAADAPDGNGGFTALAGIGLTDGTYSVLDVPGGYYWLQITSQSLVWTNLSSIDSGYDILGRPTASMPTSTTLVDLEVTGLNPSQGTDRLQIYVPNSNSSVSMDLKSWGITDGSVDLSQQVVWTNPVVDGADGDGIYITQLATVALPSGRSVQALTNSLAEPLEGISEIEGTEMVLQAELESVPTGQPLRANILGTAFAQMESAMNPSAVPDSTYFYLDVQPAGTGRGWIGATPDLVSFDGTDAPIRTDVDLGDISYGNPYPAQWPKFFDYIHYVHKDYIAPGATNNTREYAYVEVQSTTLPTASSPVVPAVGPVVAPKINNGDFFVDQSGVSTLPTISWSPSTVGVPTSYRVQIFRLYTDGTDSFSDSVADLYSKANSVQIPPGVLITGNSYVLKLSAILEPGMNVEAAPLRHTFPRAEAQALSGVITP